MLIFLVILALIIPNDVRASLSYFDFYKEKPTESLNDIDNSINLARKLLDETFDPSERFDLLYKLGNLYSIKSELIAQVSKKEINKLRSLAISCFKEILRSNKDYKNKFVLYENLAYILYKNGDPDESFKFYEILNKSKLASNYLIINANLGIAEHYIIQKNIKKSEAIYSQILKLNNPRASAFVNYKLSDYYFNEGKYKIALLYFKEGINFVEELKTKDQKFHERIKRENILGIINCYEKIKNINETYEYLKTVPNISPKDSLIKLANLFLEKKEISYAIEAYNKIISIDPFSEQNPKIQEKIIKIAKNENLTRIKENAITKLIDNYNKDSEWALYNKNKEEYKFSQNLIEYYLREKINSLSNYNEQISTILKYLNWFYNHNNAKIIRYKYAEVLYKLEQYDEALKQYEQVIELNPENEIIEISALKIIIINGTLAYGKEFINRDFYLYDVGRISEKKDVTEAENKLLNSISQYVPKLNESEAKKTKFLAGKIYFKYHNFDKAIGSFNLIISDNVPKRLAEEATRYIIKSYKQKKDWFALVNFLEELKENSKIYSGAYKQELDIEISEAKFFMLENREENYPREKLAFLYEQYELKFKQTRFAAKSLYKAALEYLKAYDLERAEKIYQKITKDYSKSEYAALLIHALGETNENILNYDKTSFYYEKLAREFPMDENSKKVLLKAINFRINNSEYKKALEDISILFQLPSKLSNDEYKDYLLKRADLFLHVKNSKEMKDTYMALLNRYRDNDIEFIEISKKYMHDLFLFDEIENAKKIYLNARRKIYDEQKSTDLDAYYKFEFALYNKNNKQINLDNLVKYFTEVIDTGQSEFTEASYYEIGLAYKNNVKKLSSGKSYNDQQTLYNQKAIGAFDACLKKAREFNVYSSWVKLCISEKEEINPSTKNILGGVSIKDEMAY
jgi:tetratricopeptide (TPR) repeat protein